MQTKFLKKLLSYFVMIALICPILSMGSLEAAGSSGSSCIEKNGVKAEFTVDSQWTGYFNGSIRVTNTGSAPIENWMFTFDLPHEITNIWNASILQHEGSLYTIKNSGWNQDIPAGGSISIGFTAAATGDITLPTFFVLNTKIADVDSSLYQVQYTLYSDWGTGYSAALTIQNLDSKRIEDWILSCSFSREISSISNAVITMHDQALYQISNNGSNQNIEPAQSIQVGLVGSGGTASDLPSSFVIKQIIPRFDLTSDTDGDLLLDWQEICIYGTDPFIPEGTTPTLTPTVMPTVTPTETPTSTPTSTPTPTPPEDLTTDTDGDKIPNYYEQQLGTDPALVDTDNDMLSDYDEVILLGFNPLSSDSDNDGIADYDEDVDSDGLSFREESQYGTNCYSSDTDQDGLKDGAEINTHHTDPLLFDTDGDTLSDGDEIFLGLNPNHQDSDGDGTSDISEKVPQTIMKQIEDKEKPQITTVQLSMIAAGNVVSNTQIENVYHVDVQTSDVPGLVGVPVELSSPSDFDTATITFSYDDTKLGNTNENDLAIMWYDAANDEYIVLDEEDVLDTENNTISYTTTHFSTYLVVDKAAWYEAWRQSIDTMKAARDQYDSSVPMTSFDYIFAIQATASMTLEESQQAQQIAFNFIDSMKPGDRCGIIFFGEAGHYYPIMASTESEKAVIKSVILQNLSIREGSIGNLSQVVQSANRILNSAAQTTNKPIVLLLTNGVNTANDGTVVPYAQSINLQISPILIDTDDTWGFDSIANATGGEVYIANMSDDIFELLYRAKINNILEASHTLDTDADGLADVIEITGILLSNSKVIYTDPIDPDKDNDTLLDGAEVGDPVLVSSLYEGEKIRILIDLGEIPAYIYCYKNKSDPTEADSDGDLYADSIDEHPLTDEVETYDLEGQDLKTKGYVKVDNGGNISYGGSQMWFTSPSIQDFMIQNYGCGLIAFTDMLAYQRNPQNFIFDKNDYMSIVYDGNNNVLPLTGIPASINLTIPVINKPIEIEPGIGAPGPQIAAALNSCYIVDNMNFYASWECSLDDVTMLEEIEDMIDRDIPVIMSIGLHLQDPLSDPGIPFYNLYLPGDTLYDIKKTDEPYQFVVSGDNNVKQHYFTVTGIFIDNISTTRKIMLRISSWGLEYYIDYSEYRAYITDYGDQLTSSIMKIS